MVPGSKWQHYMGGVYEVLGFCILEKTRESHVIYREEGEIAKKGPWWCRPLNEWNEEVAPGVKRFTEIAGE